MSRDRLLIGFLSAFLGFGFLSFLIGTAGVVGGSSEMIPGEGFQLFVAGLIAKGETLYQPITSTQFLLIPYPPIYTLITGWLAFLFGNSLLIGRMVSLVAGLVVILSICLITGRLTGSRIVGILAGMLVVSTYVFKYLGPLYRMDMLGMAFSLLGIYLAMRFEDRGRLIYWSVPLFLLAFFTKQYFIAGPVAVVVYLLIKNHWRIGSALKYGSLYFGSLVGCLLVGGLLTNWELLIHNFLYLGESNRMAWSSLIGGLRAFIFYHFPIVLGVLVYLGYKLYKKRPLFLTDVYFLVGLVVMIIATGHIGGSFHYGLEIVVVGCTMIGLLIDKAIQIFREGSPDLKSVILSGGVFVLVCLQVLGFPLGQGFLGYQFLDTTDRENQKVVSYIGDVEGIILSDRLGSPMVQIKGSPEWTVYEPAMLFVGYLYEKEGRFGWDQSELVRRLETGYYELVVTPDPIMEIWVPGTETLLGGTEIEMYRERLSKEVSSALVDNYSLVFESDWMGTNLCPYKTYIFRYVR